MIDEDLLRDGYATLYLRREVLEGDVAALRGLGYRIDDFDGRAWTTEDAAHGDLARVLAFPDYYGRNLDALNDCLSDLDVQRRVFVLSRFDVVASAMPAFAHGVLDVIANRSRIGMIFGYRLIMLVQSNDPRLVLAPVGAATVGWNRREWMNASRGL
jgi:hypothetical protein